MLTRDELRARALQLLIRAKAAAESSERLLCVLRSLECETEAEQLAADTPQPDVIGRQDAP